MADFFDQFEEVKLPAVPQETADFFEQFEEIPLQGRVAAPSEPEALRQQVIQEAARPTSERLGALAGGLGNILKFIPESIGGAAGATLGALEQVAGELPRPRTISEALTEIPRIPARLGIGMAERLIPTAGEAARRTGLDILRGGQALANMTPSDYARSIALPITLPIEAARALTPRVLTEPEIQAGVENELARRAMQEEREAIRFEGAIPEAIPAAELALGAMLPVPGAGGVAPRGALPPVIARAGAGAAPATVGSLLTEAVTGAPAAISRLAEKVESLPLVRGAQRVGTVASEVAKGTAKGVVGAVTPKTLTADWLNALGPREGALLPSREVRARQMAENALQTLQPRFAEMYERGGTLANVDDAIRTTKAEKERVWAARQAQARQPIMVDQTSIADDLDELISDRAIQASFSENEINQVKALADRYRGRIEDAATTDRQNTIINAQFEARIAKLPGTERAKILNADLNAMADDVISDGLKRTLTDALGGEFSQLGREYGAWKTLEENLLRQKVNQFKIENKTGFWERFATIEGAGNPITAAAKYAAAKGIKFVDAPNTNLRILDKRLRQGVQRGQFAPPLPASAAAPASQAPLGQRIQQVVDEPLLPSGLTASQQKELGEALAQLNIDEQIAQLPAMEQELAQRLAMQPVAEREALSRVATREAEQAAEQLRLEAIQRQAAREALSQTASSQAAQAAEQLRLQAIQRQAQREALRRTAGREAQLAAEELGQQALFTQRLTKLEIQKEADRLLKQRQQLAKELEGVDPGSALAEEMSAQIADITNQLEGLANLPQTPKTLQQRLSEIAEQ